MVIIKTWPTFSQVTVSIGNILPNYLCSEWAVSASPMNATASCLFPSELTPLLLSLLPLTALPVSIGDNLYYLMPMTKCYVSFLWIPCTILFLCGPFCNINFKNIVIHSRVLLTFLYFQDLELNTFFFSLSKTTP